MVTLFKHLQCRDGCSKSLHSAIPTAATPSDCQCLSGDSPKQLSPGDLGYIGHTERKKRHKIFKMFIKKYPVVAPLKEYKNAHNYTHMCIRNYLLFDKVNIEETKRTIHRFWIIREKKKKEKGRWQKQTVIGQDREKNIREWHYEGNTPVDQLNWTELEEY